MLHQILIFSSNSSFKNSLQIHFPFYLHSIFCTMNKNGATDWASEIDAAIKWKRVFVIDKSLQWEKPQYKSSIYNLKVRAMEFKKIKNTQKRLDQQWKHHSANEASPWTLRMLKWQLCSISNSWREAMTRFPSIRLDVNLLNHWNCRRLCHWTVKMFPSGLFIISKTRTKITDERCDEYCRLRWFCNVQMIVSHSSTPLEPHYNTVLLPNTCYKRPCYNEVAVYNKIF